MHRPPESSPPRHRRSFCTALAAALVAIPLLPSLRAGDPVTPSVRVEDARVAAVPPVSTETAAFMVLVNDGDRPVRLVGGACPIAGETAPMVTTREMREGKMVMGMTTVPALEVPAHGRRELKPGGDHLMLMALKSVPKEGGQVALTLRFEGVNATAAPTEITVQAPVVPITKGSADHGHHGH